MADNPLHQNIKDSILLSLEETFEQVRYNTYLDTGTSIFETLATINAEQASRSMGGNCATIAAHVEHMAFFLDLIPKFAQNDHLEVDWGEIWNRVSTVTPEEWEASQQRLKTSYQAIREFASQQESWENPRVLSGALGMLMHNAYHLGEIRRAICHIS